MWWLMTDTSEFVQYEAFMLEGAEACVAGKPAHQCPYVDDPLKIKWWFLGFVGVLGAQKSLILRLS